ncbi:hypothetical protein HDE68_002651 [Pedobacter cryoconitis]|uniref:DUF2586 family protein n=1 Tax=Pedobacter cryoconitis TaxID=188932 RepID=A0A7W8ZMU0_9SPHI|nr:DUF2586 family protein [Pedobacter cryoconitis]MBB5636750.1 hypothetical protein [Pedobacter cryoconitis]
MNGVKFIRENGGLARQLSGNDHISGLIVYGESDVPRRLVLSASEVEEFALNSPVLVYHVQEFFRINEGAKLYIQSRLMADWMYTEIKSLQNLAEGNIRQIAIYDTSLSMGMINSNVSNLQQVAVELSNQNIPLSILLAGPLMENDIPALSDLHNLNADRVSVVVGQDIGGKGDYLSRRNGIYRGVSCIGAVLGAVSKAKVQESIGWVEKQNLVSTAYPKPIEATTEMARELDVLGFSDGTKISDYTPAQLQSIHEKGYIFGTKYTGIAGSYLNDSFTATKLTSDFAYIENNRTVDKAIREVNKVLLPKVSGPAYVDPDTGKIQASTASALESICDDVLDQMVRNGELSGYKVVINPDQPILKTSKLEVVLRLVPVGTLREITVKIGLTLQK